MIFRIYEFYQMKYNTYENVRTKDIGIVENANWLVATIFEWEIGQIEMFFFPVRNTHWP